MVRLQEALKARVLTKAQRAGYGYRLSRRKTLLNGLSRPTSGGDEQLRRLNWALAAYARSSAALFRFSTFEEMVSGVCEAIVGDDEYMLATAGLVEHGPGSPIRLIAGAGRAVHYIDDLHLSWSEAYAEGRGPSGRAIRSGEPFVMSDAYDEPAFSPWRQRALKFGMRSSVTAPFSKGGQAIGVIKVYAGRPNAFGAQEMDVFARLGRELAFALTVEEGRAQLRAAEEARRAAEDGARESLAELARAGRVLSVGALASSIAHEVNQPVAAIMANSETALRWLAKDPPNLEQARAALQRIVRDAGRTSAVVGRTRGMLTKDMGERRWVDLSKLLQEALLFTDNQRRRAQVRADVDFAEPLPLVWADPVQVQQVAVNLISNAIDAMDGQAGGKRLGLSASPAGGNQVKVSVSDTGVGVAPDDVHRVFELLFTTKPDGIGLGLPISKTIVEAHGGGMAVAANRPRGAVFTFTLPTVPAT